MFGTLSSREDGTRIPAPAGLLLEIASQGRQPSGVFDSQPWSTTDARLQRFHTPQGLAIWRKVLSESFGQHRRSLIESG